MSKRRLDKLEGSLPPKEAVIHWLNEAHAFGSLPAYTDSLSEQPEMAQPFVAIPARVSEAVYASMRREPTAVIKTATKEAVADATFLLTVVIDLNVHIEATLRVERHRHAALYWWSRALDQRGAPKGNPSAADRSDWHGGVSALRGVLEGTEQLRRAAEARYLDGHDCLFPELATEWRGLAAAAEMLIADEGSLQDESARRAAELRIEQVLRMARADGLEASGRSVDSDAIAARVARDAVRPSSGAEHG
jgi:hypothetical protein